MAEGPEAWGTLHEGRLAALVELAHEAGKRTLAHFRKAGLAVDAKADDSPVTVADRDPEQWIRGRIQKMFPEDTVQGEEYAEQSGSSRYRWVVDPIDGTKSFICGVPLYSTLLALELDERPLAGVIEIPACDERVVAAKGLGCWHQERHGEPWRRAAVSGKSRLDHAVFVTSQVDSFAGRQAADAYRSLEQAAWITRTWGDGYGYLMVATGRADVMIDPVCNPWDVAAILPVIEEAGGRFTDWRGNPTTRGGDGVGTNGLLHDEVIGHLGVRPPDVGSSAAGS